jgi:hypothetical protein
VNGFDHPERPGLQVVGGVAAVCLLLQIASATVRSDGFETPNTATWIARTLVDRGEFAAGDRRAYHLPAEPLYLAAGFALLPAGAWRYLHVPVVVLLVASIAAVAVTVGGPSLGWAAGLIAAVDPFILVHGPVWDDAFLAAALEWSLFAILIGLAAKSAAHPVPGFAVAALLVMSALAALTRTQAQLTVGVLAMSFLVVPRLKSLRRAGAAMLVGLTIALAAWGVRNARVLGTFEIGSTRDGKALFESNCAYTRQGIRELGGVGHFTLDCAPAQVAHAFSLNEVESDRALQRYAVEYIATHPFDVAATAAFKTAVSVTGYDFLAPAFSARNLVASGVALVLLGAGLPGLVRLGATVTSSERRPAGSRRLRDVALLCAATVVAFTLLMLAIGPTGLRYRISLAGLFHIGFAAAILTRVAPVTHGVSISRIVAASRR